MHLVSRLLRPRGWIRALSLVTLAALPACAADPRSAEVRPQGEPGAARETARAARARTREMRLEVQLVPTAIAETSGTWTIAYRMENAAASTAQLSTLVLSMPAQPARASAPEPAGDYFSDANPAPEVARVTWGFLGEALRPGEARGPFAVRAAGLPTLVAYWAIPEPPLDTVLGDGREGDESEGHTFDPAHTAGWTLGVRPLPATEPPAELAADLAAMLERVCALGWIGDAARCERLRGRIAAGRYRKFVRELAAARGDGMSEAAFHLLAANADYLARRRREERGRR